LRTSWKILKVLTTKCSRMLINGLRTPRSSLITSRPIMTTPTILLLTCLQMQRLLLMMTSWTVTTLRKIFWMMRLTEHIQQMWSVTERRLLRALARSSASTLICSRASWQVSVLLLMRALSTTSTKFPSALQLMESLSQLKSSTLWKKLQMPRQMLQNKKK